MYYSNKTYNAGEVNVKPDDTVAGLRFSPPQLQGHYVASGTWANTVSCYQVQKNLTGKFNGELKSSHKHAGPVLDVCWSGDGTKIFSASADKTVKMWDLSSNQQTSVAVHDAPIRSVHWIDKFQCIMTSSWDRTLKFWDPRQPNPQAAATVPLKERAYCCDVSGQTAVVGTADKSISVYKLDPQPTCVKTIDPPLKFQLKCISIFHDAKKDPAGFALGSIEGRVAIQNFFEQPGKTNANFTFKCHRSNGTNNSPQDIYAVNDIAIHPQHGTMVTIGSDSKYSYWDKDSRTRLKISDPFDVPLTRCTFSSDGQIFGFAVGYDWSKGHEYNTPNQSKILFVPCYEDLKPKPNRNH